MTPDERLHKLRLRAKGYPRRIYTFGGRFIYYRMRGGIDLFKDLPAAIAFVTKDVERSNQPLQN